MSSPAELKLVLLTKVKKSKLWAYYPSNISKKEVDQAKGLSIYFKNQDNGHIQTKNINYYYSTYSYAGSNDKFFVFLVAGTKFDYKEAEKFFVSLFNGFKIENINTKDSVNSLNENVKTLLAQTFNLYHGENEGLPSKKNEKETVIELQEIKEEKVEEKKPREKGVLDESTSKNRLIVNEEEGGDEVDLEGNVLTPQSESFVRDPSQIQKVNWWRRMKMIFIVICILLAIALYVSIPLLMKYRDKFNSSIKNSEENVRLLKGCN